MQPAPTLPLVTALPAAHFVYNSLNLLQAFIQEGDKCGALAYLSRFSRLLRQWLCHASKTAVQLNAEMVLLDNYLSLERDRFAAGFDYQLVLDAENTDMIFVTPLAWHAVVGQALCNHVLRGPGRGLLRITFMLDDDAPVCIVHAGVASQNNSSPSFTFEQKVFLTS